MNVRADRHIEWCDGCIFTFNRIRTWNSIVVRHDTNGKGVIDLCGFNIQRWERLAYIKRIRFNRISHQEALRSTYDTSRCCDFDTTSDIADIDRLPDDTSSKGAGICRVTINHNVGLNLIIQNNVSEDHAPTSRIDFNEGTDFIDHNIASNATRLSVGVVAGFIDQDLGIDYVVT